jgi:hypothetical protein
MINSIRRANILLFLGLYFCVNTIANAQCDVWKWKPQITSIHISPFIYFPSNRLSDIMPGIKTGIGIPLYQNVKTKGKSNNDFRISETHLIAKANLGVFFEKHPAMLLNAEASLIFSPWGNDFFFEAMAGVGTTKLIYFGASDNDELQNTIGFITTLNAGIGWNVNLLRRQCRIHILPGFWNMLNGGAYTEFFIPGINTSLSYTLGR